MRRKNLGDLNRIEDESHVAVLGERDAVPLVLGFGAVRRSRVAAHVDHARHRALAVLRDVEVAGHVELRHALERDLLDGVFGPVELAGDLHIERRARGPGQQAEHVAHFFQALAAHFFPGLGRLDLGGGVVGNRARAAVEILGHRLLAFEHAPVRRVLGLVPGRARPRPIRKEGIGRVSWQEF